VILAFVEVRNGAAKPASLEAVSEARRTADKLGVQCAAVIVGSNVGGLAAEVGKHGAHKVYLAEHEAFSNYAAEGYARAVAAAAKACGAKAVFFSATSMGKDLAPTVGAILGVTVATDCTEVMVSGGALTARRPVYAGKVSAVIGFKKSPALISLRPNVFAAQALGGASSGEKLSFDAGELKTVVSEVVQSAKGKVELTEASVIVSGGRGLKGPENFNLRDSVAEPLGAAVGASRAVVDAGWRPYAEQVGQTGKTVSPNLYVALGISGAIQHLAGMSSSKVIVAINKDKDAPIFKLANYGIVGDVFAVCPILAEELKKALGK
jgi:electron transfer flavoprotein alpha subunit